VKKSITLEKGESVALFQVGILNQGTIIGFRPLTETAKQWFDDNVHSDGWQWLGGVLWVDQRMARDLIIGLQDAELV